MRKRLLIGFVVIVAMGLAWLALPLSTPSAEKPVVPATPTAVRGEKQTGTDARELGRLPPQVVPVLMYHSVGPEKGNDAVITRERFAEQMNYLRQNDYHPISLDELEAYMEGRGKLPPKPVVLTFDDGYRDTYEVVFPILKKHGFRSVLFIPATFVGSRLTWQELQEMRAAGMEIASHSYTHRDLGKMSPAEQAEEIARAKEILDRNLQQDTRYFCYPNSSYNQVTLRLLREKGFKLAFTIEPGWAKPGDDPLTLRRVWMGNSVDVLHLEERLTREDYSIL